MQEHLYGYIERIVYQNQENGFTVAQLKQPGRQELSCLVGAMPSIQPGETVGCHGQWKKNTSHGLQFVVEDYEVEAPATAEGIKKYLASNLVKGIGPTYAERIVQEFGAQTLDIIDNNPKRLLDVPGIGKKRQMTIAKHWGEQKSIREVMVFLQSYGVTPAYAQKIFKIYKEQCIDKLKENPYRLATEIHGIGFKTADKIARTMGVTHDSDQRLEAGIEFVLAELSNEGHVCYPQEEFIEIAASMLDVDQEAIKFRLSMLSNDQRVVSEHLVTEGKQRPFIWLKPLHLSENGIARRLHTLMDAPRLVRQVDVPKAIEWVEQKLNFDLAHNQKLAIAQSLTTKVQIISGGPGTGKSTITNAILTIYKKLTTKILLAAPTGRAAKRMGEITSHKASTIHSLLEFDFNIMGFKRNRDNPLDCDLLIIDEASMIDTYLMYHLLKAIPDHAQLIFVGDAHQLPSVGPGNVLKDMIDSRQIHTTILTDIFRQAANSKIITNAHRINNGKIPETYHRDDSDFFFIEKEDPQEVLITIRNLAAFRLPRKYHFDPLNDIQVIAPMKRGVIGIDNLNTTLQEVLNPKGKGIMRYGIKYLVGDKVMQIKNNYNKNTFNGDIGRIEKIDNTEQEMAVNYDGREVIYSFGELDELVLSYAVSIHKFQGSECPCIIMPVHTTHFKLLCRNLLYTGVTRGKKLVVLVGTKKALALSVNNQDVLQRHTGLQQAIIS
ncbi:MAG: SF1B family DNA helicase RecD2 [Chlamydiota bacterium]